MNPNDQPTASKLEDAFHPEMSYDLLRLPAVLRARGRSRTMHYHDIRQGLFTPPVPVGLRAVGWPSYEVAALNGARIAGKCEEDIRALVTELIAARHASVKVG